MTTILDQQFVTHLFAPVEGPGGDAAYQALREIWQGCGLMFGMTRPIAGISLPQALPETRGALPADGETAFAAQERPGANCQAIIRRHHDLLNLSIGLAPSEASSPAASGRDWSWWQSFDYQWTLLTAPHVPRMLGEARIYLTRVDAETAIRDAAPALYASLGRLLPPAAGQQDPSAGVATPRGLALWETTTSPEERFLRRFVLAIAPDADPAASAWVWSRGDTAIPPLARYLLHAAKLRYEMRVWQRDSQARRLQTALDSASAELQRLDAADPAKEQLLRLRYADAMRLHTGLRALRKTVEIAAANLGRSLDRTGLLVSGSLFSDDADLASSLLEQLDDEIGYLGLAAELAAQHPAVRRPVAEPAMPPEPTIYSVESSLADDRRRNVFVVYGRDALVRGAVFDFLRALDLRPLEWELLVKEAGRANPVLSEAIRKGLALARAVVVVMTPEDIVHLHPDLHEPHEKPAETQDALQPRPNVLLELGMALMSHPDRTVLLKIGDQRPISDLAGMSFIQIVDDAECRNRIASRLKVAGCAVETGGQDWLNAGDFATLAGLYRKV